MYLPKAFAEHRREILDALLRAYPLATVLLAGADGIVANLVPFELDEPQRLSGHVARGNELARADGAEVLLLFHGPQGYVSPNWYPSKHVHGREVPTWNYVVIEVRGRLRVIDDAQWLRAFLERFTDRHEASLTQPWHVGDAPPDHIETSLRAIVGLQVAISHISGKFKLSQNHPAGNRAGVVEGLRSRAAPDDAELADLMVRIEEFRDGR
jgi:transcriptional regulator